MLLEQLLKSSDEVRLPMQEVGAMIIIQVAEAVVMPVLEAREVITMNPARLVVMDTTPGLEGNPSEIIQNDCLWEAVAEVDMPTTA